MSTPLSHSLAQFGALLRQCGIHAGLPQTMDATIASQTTLLAHPQQFQTALRALYCTSPDQFSLFDHLFQHFWLHQPFKQPEPARPKPSPDTLSHLKAMMLGQSETPTEDESKITQGASRIQRLQHTDFSRVPQTDLSDLEALALRLTRIMSRRISRKIQAASRGRQIHMRRTIRAAISTGGDPIHLRYKSPSPNKIKPVFLLDVSGSMEAYAIFYLRFIYVLQRYFSKLRAFVFSTQVHEVTACLKGYPLNEALGLVGHHAPNFSGGTRIGECLAETLQLPHDRLFDPHTILFILSDGLDTGEPMGLARQLQKIRNSGTRIIWLNPLKGAQNYQPLARGIQAAQPFIDHHLPGYNLTSLLALEPYLLGK